MSGIFIHMRPNSGVENFKLSRKKKTKHYFLAHCMFSAILCITHSGHILKVSTHSYTHLSLAIKQYVLSL